MGHNHTNHNHGWWHSHHHAWSNIKIAFFLNLLFTIIEFIGWFLTNSVSVMANAVHDLWDSLSLWLAWKLELVSKKWRTKNYTYWYKRFSVLAAFINSLVLISWSIYVLTQAIPRLIVPEPSDFLGMFYLAIFWVIVNWYGAYKVMKWNTLSERVVSLHLLEDVLWWVWILIISIVNFFIQIPLLDPLLATVFTIFILWNVVKNLKEVIKVFMQSVPSGVNVEKIENKILKISWVSNIHDVHIWTMDLEDYIMTCHIKLENNLNIENTLNIKNKVRQELKNHKINHSTIEFDSLEGKCEYSNC